MKNTQRSKNKMKAKEIKRLKQHLSGLATESLERLHKESVQLAMKPLLPKQTIEYFLIQIGIIQTILFCRYTKNITKD